MEEDAPEVNFSINTNTPKVWSQHHDYLTLVPIDYCHFYFYLTISMSNSMSITNNTMHTAKSYNNSPKFTKSVALRLPNLIFSKSVRSQLANIDESIFHPIWFNDIVYRLKVITTQETMESFAFPDKIDGIKNWWTFFGPLKVLQKRSKLNAFHWKYQ